MLEFAAALRSGRVLLMDGAMGTELLRKTHAPSEAAVEQYNLSQPDLVRSIHESYLDAGADVLLTNTFQANPGALRRTGLKTDHDVWSAAISLARGARLRQHYVLADIGPLERVTAKTVETLLAECVNVDGILLETWSSPNALCRFFERHASLRLPMLVSFTFQRTDGLRTFRHARPEQCARAADRLGATALGANCGKDIGMDDMLEIVRRYRDASDLPIFVRPNAGTPPQKGWRYPRTPAAMAAGLGAILAEGVAMVGGCCGTTPAHIRAFRETIDSRFL